MLCLLFSLVAAKPRLCSRLGILLLLKTVVVVLCLLLLLLRVSIPCLLLLVHWRWIEGVHHRLLVTAIVHASLKLAKTLVSIVID